MLMASQTGIAGCVIIEDEVTFYGVRLETTSGITIEYKTVVMGQTRMTWISQGGKSYLVLQSKIREIERVRLNIKKIPEILNKLK